MCILCAICKESKDALDAILKSKVINCQNEAFHTYVQSGKLISVKNCEIDTAQINETMMKQGWVHRDADTGPDLSYMEDEARYDKVGLWR